MRCKIGDERFSFLRTKSRGDKSAIDMKVLGAQKIRFRLRAGQKKENRVRFLVGLGNIFFGNKFKPLADARLLQRLHIFLRAIKAKIVIQHGGRADLFPRLEDADFSIGGRYHG